MAMNFLAGARGRPDGTRPDWLPPLAFVLTAAVGLLNVGSALTPNLAWRTRRLLHIESADYVPLAHALALSAGVALLVVAVYLGRRRRRALQVAVAVLFVAGVLNLVKGLDWEEALVTWAVGAFLLLGRRALYVRQELSVGRALKLVPMLAGRSSATGSRAACCSSPATRSGRRR